MESGEILNEIMDKETVKVQDTLSPEGNAAVDGFSAEAPRGPTFSTGGEGGTILSVYIEQLKSLTPLPAETEVALCKEIKGGERAIEASAREWCGAIGGYYHLEEDLLVAQSKVNHRPPFTFHKTPGSKLLSLQGMPLQLEKICALRKELVRLQSVPRNGTERPDSRVVKQLEEYGEFEISKIISRMRMSGKKAQRAISSVEPQGVVRSRRGADWKATKKCLEEILATIGEHLFAIRKNKEELIRAHLPLSIHIAGRYRHRGVDFLDLVQEGNQGLMRAVDTFDYRRGNRFASYAMWWVKQSIIRAVYNQSRTMRIPVYLYDRLNHYHTVSENLLREKGRNPTLQELAGDMKVSMDCLVEMANAFKAIQPLEDYHQTSFDGCSREGDNGSFSEVVVHADLQGKVETVLSQLPDREGEILKLRFGINGAHYEHSLQEIGQKFNLSRERIRQIEQSALHRIRKMGGIEDLREFLG